MRNAKHVHRVAVHIQTDCNVLPHWFNEVLLPMPSLVQYTLYNVQITVFFVHPSHHHCCSVRSLAMVFIIHGISSLSSHLSHWFWQNICCVSFIAPSRGQKVFFFWRKNAHDAFITIDERHVGDERDVHFRVDSLRFFLHFAYYLISNLIISHYYAPCMLGIWAREHKKIQMK